MARLTNSGARIEKLTDHSKMVTNVQTVFDGTGMKMKNKDRQNENYYNGRR